jgi:hypothetical protein
MAEIKSMLFFSFILNRASLLFWTKKIETSANVNPRNQILKYERL